MTITFFMIVSGREEPIIADYAIKSFSKLTKLNFKLIVYLNYIDDISKNLFTFISTGQT